MSHTKSFTCAYTKYTVYIGARGQRAPAVAVVRHDTSTRRPWPRSHMHHQPQAQLSSTNYQKVRSLDTCAHTMYTVYTTR